MANRRTPPRKTTPRPTKTSNVRQVFSVRFSPAELAQLRSAVKIYGGSIAATVRRIVIGNLSQSGTQPIMLGSDTVSPSRVQIYGELAAGAESRTAA